MGGGVAGCGVRPEARVVCRCVTTAVQRCGQFRVQPSFSLCNSLGLYGLILFPSLVSTVQSRFSENAAAILKSASLFAYGLVVALQTSVSLSLVILCSFPIVGIILSQMWRLVRNNDKIANEAMARAAAVSHELLAGIETVLSLNMQDAELKRYEQLIRQSEAVMKQNARIGGLGWGSYHGSMFLAFAVAFWYGGKLVTSGELTPGNVLVCFTQLAIGVTALGNIGGHYQALREADTLLEGMYRSIELQTARETSQNDSTLSKSVSARRIEFKGVSFSYPSRPDVLVLDNFNLVIDAGFFVAIVAESGSGKSTIFALLLRLISPTKGAILLDGINIQEIPVEKLRSQFAVVEQTTHLFTGMTIFENLILGTNSAEQNETDLQKALQMAHAGEIIEKLPQGIWTEVRGVGGGFSGGQRQRFGLARAFLGYEKRGCLLFDEPTSALDADSEQSVLQGIKQVSESKTVLLITHRLALLGSNVDKIIVLVNGQVGEQGTHAELMAKNSRYRNMLETQRHELTSATAQNLGENPIPSVSEAVNVTNSDADKSFDENPKKLDWRRVIKMALPQKWFILLGIVGMLLEGLIFPIEGFLISSVVASYSLSQELQPQATAKYSLGLVGLAILAFTCCVSIGVGSGCSNAILISDLRVRLLQKLLHQNLEFFDEKKHSVAHLDLIFSDAVKFLETVPAGYGSHMGKALISVGLGLSVALTYSAKLTIIALACVPFVVGIGWFQYSALAFFQAPSIQASEQLSLFILSTLDNTRTIAILTAEPTFHKAYKKLSDAADRAAYLQLSMNALVGQPFRDALVILIATAGLNLSVAMIKSGSLKHEDMLIALTTLTLSAVDGVGAIAGLSGDGLAVAARDFWKVVGILDWAETEGQQAEKKYTEVDIRGNVAAAFENVTHEYKSRAGVLSLDNYNLRVNSGEIFLLTGKSGSGKSTVVQLLQKLRTATHGNILIFGQNINLLDPQSLRSKVIAVSQKSKLFSRTIDENLRLSNTEVDTQDIEDAVTLAGAADFIANLPMRYKTVIGGSEGGTSSTASCLSEGQAQRLCIARALIQNPYVLILDEATSGLDRESERLVVDGLRRWLRNDSRRTLIVSTHTPQFWK
ncbi:P-loop containing nucleoside triphosphate hydrolase protein [Chytriomyces cf. hyalinus JEL632]|nr:P-loop containing nucleoside triphosphate hydrolase protein [Chytriomyces cf. hyalinus JEL632]